MATTNLLNSVTDDATSSVETVTGPAVVMIRGNLSGATVAVETSPTGEGEFSPVCHIITPCDMFLDYPYGSEFDVRLVVTGSGRGTDVSGFVTDGS